MQTVYIGNTLINDVYLGSQRMDDTLQLPAQYTKSGLKVLWDGNYNTTTSSWRATVGNYTASASGPPPQVTLVTGSGLTSYYTTDGTGSLIWGNYLDIVSTEQDLSKDRTVLIWTKPGNLTNEATITRIGGDPNASDGYLELDITSAATSNKLKLKYGPSDTSQTAATLSSVATGSWQMVGYTTNGSTTANIELWLNNSKQALTGSTNWEVTAIGFGQRWTFTGNPYATTYPSGSVAYHFVYNRKLTDVEINGIYNYMQSQFIQ
jgi:hypothetical protein